MIPRFGRPVSVISLITNDVIDYIYDIHGHLITQRNQDLPSHGALQRYAEGQGPGGTPYNGLYWEAPPKRGTFFRLQVYERVGISQVEVYKRVGKSVISVFKRPLIILFRIDAPYGCISLFI